MRKGGGAQYWHSGCSSIISFVTGTGFAVAIELSLTVQLMDPCREWEVEMAPQCHVRLQARFIWQLVRGSSLSWGLFEWAYTREFHVHRGSNRTVRKSECCGDQTIDGRLLNNFGEGGDVMETLPLRKIISFLFLSRPSRHTSFSSNLALFTSFLLW